MLTELCARLWQATVPLLSAQVLLRAFSLDPDLSLVESKHIIAAHCCFLLWDDLFGTVVRSEQEVHLPTW